MAKRYYPGFLLHFQNPQQLFLVIIFITNSNNRQMIKARNLASPSGQKELAITERQILNVVDLCPQILKEDKLFIRNKVKEIFKDININDPGTEDDNIELLEIFKECRKPLSKLHLYENHYHWFQVKLRKYINNQRKKLKQDYISQFKKQKQRTNEKNYQKEVTEDKSIRDTPKKGNISSRVDYKNSSVQASLKVGTPTDKKAINSLKTNFTEQYRKNKPSKSMIPQSCKNVLLSSNNQNANIFQRLRENISIQRQKKRYEKEMFKKSNNSMSKYKLQTKGHVQRQTKSKYKNNDIHRTLIQKDQNQDFPHIIETQRKSKAKRSNEKIARKQSSVKSSVFNKDKLFSKPQKSSQKNQPWIPKPNNQYASKDDVFSSIKKRTPEVINYSSCQGKKSSISNFNIQDNDNLFTSPQLLQECRRFIQKSETAIRNSRLFSSNQTEDILKTSFLQEIKTAHRDNYQSTLYHSPTFQPKLPLSKFNEFKQFLRYMFSRGWAIFISTSECEQLIQKCPYEYQKQIQLFLTNANQKHKCISFLDIISFLEKELKVTFAFSNIFLLLDVDSKGFVADEDYTAFLENFENSALQQNMLVDLRDKLFKFKQVVQCVFRGQKTVHGCFEYLELMEKKQIFELGEILQLFQFEIDAS